MPIAQLLPAFNAGELSPLLDARVDIEKYVSGCRELENFITTPYGPNMRRPGTEMLGETKDSSTKSGLIPFIFSESTSFQMEFGENYVRFWNSDGTPYQETKVTVWTADDGGGPPAPSSYSVGQFVTNLGITYMCLIAHTTAGVFATDLALGRWVAQSQSEVVTVYNENDLLKIQWAQINDLFYMAQLNHAPWMITRNGDQPLTPAINRRDWTAAETSFDWPPLLDENTSAITLTPSATTGTITLQASSFPGTGPFNVLHVGAYFQIAHLRPSSTVAKTFAASGTSSTIQAFGGWAINTYGTWAGTLTLERSYDAGASWSEIRSYTATSDRNFSTAGSESKECLLRLNFSNRTVGTSADKAMLTMDDPKAYGLVKVTAFTDSTEVTALVVNDLYSVDPTTNWTEGAWSDYQGYPRAIAVHEDRVYYAGTRLRPQSIWGTAIDDFQNFRTGILADGGLFFTIASNKTSPIQWMQSKDGFLHVGRLDSEGRLSSSDSGLAISPGDINWKPTTSYGSRHLPSVILNDALLFVQGQGRKVRSLAQVPQTSAFSAQDVTILSEHITKGEIVQFAAQNTPDSILWAIRGDGVLLGMAYDSLSSVVAWQRHSTNGLFESVSVIPTTSGDEVWFIVNRTVEGVTKRLIERFKPGWRETWEDEDKNEWWYLDCAKRVENDPPSATVVGLDHLEGETVRVLSDGADAGKYVVNGGEITLNASGAINIVGLSYNSIMRPMKLNSDLRNGTSQGRKVKIDRIVARLLSSLGGEYSTDGVNYDDIPMRSAQDDLDASPPVFTGDTDNLVDRGNHRDHAEVWIRQSAPMPLTVLSIVAKWTPSND